MDKARKSSEGDEVQPIPAPETPEGGTDENSESSLNGLNLDKEEEEKDLSEESTGGIIDSPAVEGSQPDIQDVDQDSSDAEQDSTPSELPDEHPPKPANESQEPRIEVAPSSTDNGGLLDEPEPKKDEQKLGPQGPGESLEVATADPVESPEKTKPPEESNHSDTNIDELDLNGVVDIVKSIAKYTDVIKADKVLRRLDERILILRRETEEAEKKAFIEAGGEEGNFQFEQGELFDAYDATHRLIKDNRRQFVKQQERDKEMNFARAEDLLERLRQFLEDPESVASFDKFKKLQDEWKGIGSLPRANYKSLWANYNALVSRFYDRRSIYFDLIDLDRKKNLDLKTELCEKAEGLDAEDNLHKAILQLNELHNEFKHVGPVPRDQQESVWRRFKAASDKVYERRREQNAGLKKQVEERFGEKQQLVKQVMEFPDFSSDKISEWNNKTKEILAIQKKWEALGGLPRNKAKNMNRDFWKAFKKYFHNKNQFFKKLDGVKSENLVKKEELIKKAEALVESSDWNKTSDEFRTLQRHWKEIGPVPEKARKDVFERFKAAGDAFFQRKRDNAGEIEKEYQSNLEVKRGIIDEISKLKADDKDFAGALEGLQVKFFDAGFVPREEVSAVHNAYASAISKVVEASKELSDEEKERLILSSKLEEIKNSPNAGKKLQIKEDNLRKQISGLENDISLWQNNMEFFANTKNAEKLKQEFTEKISKASKDLTKLKKELKFFRSV